MKVELDVIFSHKQAKATIAALDWALLNCPGEHANPLADTKSMTAEIIRQCIKDKK